MKAFTSLYKTLDETTSTNAKVEAMTEYFSGAGAENSAWAIALLTGRRPKRPVNTSLLRIWATDLAGIPLWLFEESYAVAGDLAETISLLIPHHESKSEGQLAEIMREILSITKQEEPHKKDWLLKYWKSLSQEEIFVFNKLITGSFRVGVSKQLVYKALAKVHQLDEKDVAHKLMGNWSPLDTDIQAILKSGASSDHSKPYPFYLAYQLDQDPRELGKITDWQIERKYDGIRGQIIKRGGELHIWSRGEDLMTEKFVEFAELSQILPEGTVLDGEILPFKNNKIMSFSEMQKRIGRKNLSKKILQEVPLCMMCYDLLEHKGADIRMQPLKQRRMLLEDLLAECPTDLLKLSPLVPCSDWSKLDQLRNESKTLGCEGLMLKHSESVYETGRRRGKWWKWKVDPYTVDAVLIYAQSGHGRRANLYTDYTFAVRDKGELVPFAKAYSGLTDKELIEVDHWIKRNTLEKFGPVRSVKAELVFEIAFEGINASPRHKSGIALRFPRILRWRKDKTKEEINTKDDLLQLLNAV